MASNAWERAQDAIAHASQRATERDEDVITPDSAVSPFDAASTTILPHTLTSRGGRGHDPDLTQRLRHDGLRPNGPVEGQQAPDRPRNGHHRRPDDDEDGDPTTVRFDTRPSPAHPGTSPFPANPFPGGPGPAPEPEHDETPAEEPRRSWWRRLFGR